MAKVPYNLADDETFAVKVYRDHADWDSCSRWFLMRSELLRELFVCAYTCDRPEHIDWIENAHPDCVYVY